MPAFRLTFLLLSDYFAQAFFQRNFGGIAQTFFGTPQISPHVLHTPAFGSDV